jgi:uncharacterized protein (DUF58 family)
MHTDPVLARHDRWDTREAPGVTLNPRRIYILPTRVGLLLAVVLLATLMGSLNYQNNLGLFFSFLMAGVAIVSMHHCWFNLVGLRLIARDGIPVFRGQRARFHVQVSDPKGRLRGEVCLKDGDCSTPSPASAELSLSRPATRRGRMRLGSVTIESRYPLGLFRAWSKARLQAEVLVYPRPAPRAPLPHARAVSDHRARGRFGIGAEDFVGLRPYREGDPPNQLDWKALARERGLVVKQFGGDQTAQVWLDWAHVPGPDTESRLELLCRQVLDASAQERSFGLRLPGRTIEPNRGEQHKHRCLEALARFGDD